ncbi:MAG: 4-hydroxythreonine-4-phosphate dehydrogenase PdxA [Mariprofundaceae bacterium]|nr:4-hydroxythreonine-4-phosphate dehydrogenase PdxA [Mariprofundaceae bacterium]
MTHAGDLTAPLLITLGEPAGIGPDVVLLGYHKNPALFQACMVLAPMAWLKQRAIQLNCFVPIIEYACWHECAKACMVATGLHCWNPEPSLSAAPVQCGTPSLGTAAAVIACISHAAKRCLAGDAAAMVTAPIEKAVLRNAGFSFPGHTEFLAALAADACHGRNAKHVAMMLASSVLRVVLLTTHLPLRDVPDALNIDDTLKIIRITHDDLQQRFGINEPRIGVCGLNPHAGEQGHFGDEEGNILVPAIHLARNLGINVADVMPADTLFSAQMRAPFDAIVCCYHDQALIPIKALSFGDAVNITLGLPFVRTSVDHGTALDRAGTGDIHCGSLLQAITVARNMHQ